APTGTASSILQEPPEPEPISASSLPPDSPPQLDKVNRNADATAPAHTTLRFILHLADSCAPGRRRGGRLIDVFPDPLVGMALGRRARLSREGAQLACRPVRPRGRKRTPGIGGASSRGDGPRYPWTSPKRSVWSCHSWRARATAPGVDAMKFLHM